MTFGPQVSVLVPARNAARWLRFALRDVLDQRRVVLEVLVVDDHSTDRTKRWIERFAASDTRVIPVPASGRGIAAALRAALARAQAPLVGMMEADDRCHPHRFEVLVETLRTNPDWDGVVSRTTLFGAPSAGMRRYLDWQNALATPDELAQARFVEIPALLQTGLFRRAWIDGIGGFAEPECWPLDIDFWMRAFAAGARIGRVPRPLYRWRQHAAQDTRTSERHRLATLQRCKAHYFARGPGAARAIDVVSVGRTLGVWAALLVEEGASDVRAIEWKPGSSPPPRRRDGAVRLFVYGMPAVRDRVLALVPDFSAALDWFAA